MRWFGSTFYIPTLHAVVSKATLGIAKREHNKKFMGKKVAIDVD